MNLNIPQEIYDIINLEWVNTEEFLQDINNIIINIDNKWFALSRYFYPFNDDFIIYDCKDYKPFELKNNINHQIEYVNLEKIGIKTSNTYGNIVEKKLFEDVLKKTQIIKFEHQRPIYEILRASSKLYLLNPEGHGAVGALHCQKGYVGRIFLPFDLTNNNTDIIFVNNKLISPNFELIVNKNIFDINTEILNITDNQLKLVSWIINSRDDYFSLVREDRDYLDYLGYKNPYNYPKQYFNILQEEKIGNDLLINTLIPNYNIEISNNDNIIEEPFKNLGFLNMNDYEFVRDLLSYDNLIIAGEFVHALYKFKMNEQSYYDIIDLYFYSCDIIIAKNILEKIIKTLLILLNNDRIQDLNIISNKESFSIIFTREKEFHLKFSKVIYHNYIDILNSINIDCCCLLIKENQIYSNKRGYYSLMNDINLINFDRIPDEHQLIKFLQRNVGIYIPQINHFKNNFITNVNQLCNLKYGNIINKYLLTNKTIEPRYTKIKINQRNYKKLISNINFLDKIKNIKLEDNILWYPQKSYREEEIKYFTNNELIQCGNITFNNEKNGCCLLSKIEEKIEYFNYHNFILDLLSNFTSNLLSIGTLCWGQKLDILFKNTDIELVFINTSPDDMFNISNKIYKYYSKYLLDKYMLNYKGEYKTEYENRDNYIKIKTIFESRVFPDIKIHTRNDMKKYKDVINYLSLNDYNEIEKVILNKEGEYYCSELTKYCVENKLILGNINDIEKYNKIGFVKVINKDEETNIISEYFQNYIERILPFSESFLNIDIPQRYTYIERDKRKQVTRFFQSRKFNDNSYASP